MRATQIIQELDLRSHPEGGYYREIQRSESLVRPLDGRPERSAMTTIYFLLVAGQVSRWHRVRSDEVWHHYEGDPVALQIMSDDFSTTERRILGPLAPSTFPAQVVPANHWQTARSLGDYSLVGCTVGPGFDFADFSLLRDTPERAAVLKQRHPEWGESL